MGAFFVKANYRVTSGASHSQSRPAAPVMGHTAVKNKVWDIQLASKCFCLHEPKLRGSGG